MKKSLYLVSLVVLVLGACSKNEVIYTQTEVDAVSFGAYSGRIQSKAGSTDAMDLDKLKTNGFGVFATYTGTGVFSAASDNFMYNQKVYWADLNGDNTTTWEYAPIKYWPNPTNGESADAQKVSFFAYAPYAEPSSNEEYGIMGFSIDNTTKHNMVSYGFKTDTPPVPNVDLMWGYRSRTGAGTAASPYVYTVNTDQTRAITTVPFIFQHMLSKLAGSQDGDPANVGANGLIIKANPTADPTNGFGTANGTKVTVSKIVVKSAEKDKDGNTIVYAADGSVQTGKLDLVTGVFTMDTAVQPIKFSQTLSADATEVAAGASELADALKEVPNLTDFTAVNTGVTKTAVNVYKSEVDPIILIPGTKPVVDVTITYVVRTYDAKIPGEKKFSEVPQTVFGKVTFPTIEKNKKYNLLILIGLNDVKFEATVEDWTLGRSDTNNDGVLDELDDITVNLPANL